MKTITFRPGTSVESCYARLRKESLRCGDVVCGDFNDTLMRSDESLRTFYQRYHSTQRQEAAPPIDPSDIVGRFARQYAMNIPQFEHNREYSETDFKAGMRFWAEIQRDADGFVSEECLEEMFANMPFLIFDRDDNDIEAICCDDWRSEIETKPYYSHWKPIPLPLRDTDTTK